MKTFLRLILLIALSALGAGNLYAQNGMVYFNPDTSYINVNDSTVIDIAVDSNIEGIHCFIVSIGFDTSLVELADVVEGPLLPNIGQTFFFWNQTETGYDIGSCILGFGLFADGPGVIATMKFRARQTAGPSSLHFTSQEFTDTLLNPIYVIPLYGAIIVEDSTTSIGSTENNIPEEFTLFQNFPNPFNAQTSIKYGLRDPGYVEIEVYDILGRLQDVLVSEEKPAGYHYAIWDAGGSSSGIYYLRMRTGGLSQTRKMLLIK